MPTLANAQAAGTPYPLPSGCTNVATEGQDFWVIFGNNANQAVVSCYLALQLVNGNSNSVTVTLTFTATGQSANYTVPANTSQQVDLSNVTTAGGTTGANLGDMRQSVYNSGVNPSNSPLHITCPAFISVIAFNTYQATTDATILLPTTIWGQEYYNLSYQAMDGSGSVDGNYIIANQNNTTVTIKNFNDNTTLATATINAGEIYNKSINNFNDLTGLHIITNKPVAYFVHNPYANYTSGGSMDILFQQLMPVNQYGYYFLVPNETQFGANTAASDNLLRVLASQDGTVVNFTNANAFTDPGYTQGNGYVAANPTNGAAVSSITLNKGQWTQMRIGFSSNGGQDSCCTIAASQPIAVVDFMMGGSLSKGMGDPAICRISPIKSMVNTAIIAPFIPPATFPRGGSSWLGRVSSGSLGGIYSITPRHYALIISPTATKDNVVISRNGVSLGTLTAAAAAVPNLTDATNPSPYYPGDNIISAPTQWVDVPTPLNGVLYSYIRYDFNYQTDAAANFRITAPQGGILITQAGIGEYESYTVNSGAGGCLVNY